VLVVGILVGSSMLIRQSMRSVVRQYGAQRFAQVTDVAHVVENDISEIASDLSAAGRLYWEATSDEERLRALETMALIVENYKVIEIYDDQGRRLLSAADQRSEFAEGRAPFEEPRREIVERALASLPGDVAATLPILGAAERSYHAFATSYQPAAPGARRIVVVILLETGPVFAKVRLLAPDRNSRLLLLGPHGKASLVSSSEVKEIVDAFPARADDLPTLSSIVDRMREGESGIRMLDAHEAAAIGFDRAEAVCAFSVVNTHGGRHWSLAAVSSVQPLQAQQRRLVLRVLFGAGTLTALLIAFAAYIIAATRREATMRERLRVFDRIAHMHEKTEKILDNIPVGVLALGDDGRVSAHNRALRERSPEIAIGATLREAFASAPDPVVDKLTRLLDACLAEGAVRSLHGERMTLFGQEGQFSIHAVPLDRRIPEARALLVIEDVSEIRALASQLVRAEKLSTVGVLGAGIAHEIGTPLGVIRGRAERIVMKLGQDHPQTPSVGIIVEQIDAVTRTIQKLLDFSRVKLATVQPVSVARVARTVSELLRFEASRRKIEVEIDVSESLPALAADTDELQQVLVNLVMNSFDACAPGGHVKVSARAERLEQIGGKPSLRITVADDGCGIPKSGQEQIFDPFFTTKKRGQGTGLGLTVVAHIVRNHSGQIELESEPGRGTSITLVWPIAQNAAEGRHAASA
jgi:signal transduction histidine kinase